MLDKVGVPITILDRRQEVCSNLGKSLTIYLMYLDERSPKAIFTKYKRIQCIEQTSLGVLINHKHSKKTPI